MQIPLVLVNIQQVSTWQAALAPLGIERRVRVSSGLWATCKSHVGADVAKKACSACFFFVNHPVRGYRLLVTKANAQRRVSVNDIVHLKQFTTLQTGNTKALGHGTFWMLGARGGYEHLKDHKEAQKAAGVDMSLQLGHSRPLEDLEAYRAYLAEVWQEAHGQTVGGLEIVLAPQQG